MASPRRVRHYLLDPRFQLKWTAYLVAVVLLVMGVLGTLVARVAARSSATAEIAVTQAEKAFEESRSNSILAKRTVQLAAGDNPTLAAVMDESLGEVDAQSEKNLAEVKTKRDEIARDRRHIGLLLAVSGVTMALLLTFMGIIITHRVVGPVLKIKRLLRRVGTGRLVIEERLRKGDELEDLFDTFLQMTFSLRAMQNARVKTLDGTMRRAEETGASKEVIDSLRALRAQMVLGMEPRKNIRASRMEF